MRLKKLCKIFKRENVSVCGMRGRGKDLLFANVILRRRKSYISNVDYGGDRYPLDFSQIDPKNTYDNFITGNVNPYVYPYPDGTDIYLSDAGVYFPSQYCNELNKKYATMPVYQALSRHLGDCNFHTNAQNLNRVWDKIREQSDTYILCRWCIYVPLVNIVLQGITIYDRYQSAFERQKPLKLPASAMSDRNVKMNKAIMKAQFEASHGTIKNRLLIYHNRSKYNTRLFKEVLACEETSFSC